MHLLFVLVPSIRRLTPTRAAAVLALLATVAMVTALPAAAARDCSNTSTQLIPLTDMGALTYEGESGGLYPGGSNEVPAAHLELGEQLAAQVVPRGPDGAPLADGRIVMVSIGVSNTLAEFNAFADLVASSPANPQLSLVNGAQVGRALGQWASARSETTWNRLDSNLRESGVTPQQVQVAWVKLPSSTRGPRTLADARDEIAQFTRVVNTAKERYPNLFLMYVSSRIYGGYIEDGDSEPNAYLHGFGMKWLIEEQIEGAPELNADASQGPVRAPWIGWGPYMWADGENPRSDGLVWPCEDFALDGVHPGDGAQQKVASMLLEHFASDPTAIGWFAHKQTEAPGTSSEPSEDPPKEATSTSAPPDPTTTLRNRSGETTAEDLAIQPATRTGVPWLFVIGGVGTGLLLGSSVGYGLSRRRRPTSKGG